MHSREQPYSLRPGRSIQDSSGGSPAPCQERGKREGQFLACTTLSVHESGERERERDNGFRGVRTHGSSTEEGALTRKTQRITVKSEQYDHLCNLGCVAFKCFVRCI